MFMSAIKRDKRYVIRNKFLTLLLVAFLTIPYTLPIPSINAQDDGGTNDVSGSVSDSSNTDSSVNNDQSIESGNGSAGISEQSRDSWATDPNFNDANTSESSGEQSGGLAPGSHDSWATDPNFSVADNVNQAAYNESQAYQSLYSYEEAHGMDGSAEHQALQQAAAEASAATQNAQAAFDGGNSPAVDEATSVADASRDFAATLSGLNSGNFDLETAQSQIDQALGSIPGSLHAGERAAAIGGAIPDPKTAGEIAQMDAISRGEGVGTQMGAFQIAYSTSAGTHTSGNDIAREAIAAAFSSLDINDPKQTENFINAAFSTAQTHGANPADVLAQLQSLGVNVSNQDQVISAAVSHGISPDKVYSGTTTTTAAVTTAQAANTGPNAQAQPAPAPAQMHAPEPVTVQPPVQAPAPVSQPAQNPGSDLQPGYSATTTHNDSSEGKFTTSSSTTSFTGPEGYVGTVSVTTTYDPGIPGDSKFPATSTTVVTSNVGGRDPNQQTAISGVEVPPNGNLTTSQTIDAARQAGISVPGTK